MCVFRAGVGGLGGVELSVGNNITRLFSFLYIYIAVSHTWTLFFLCVFTLILLVLIIYVLLS